MLTNKNRAGLISLCFGCSLFIAVVEVRAQWGNNAPPCSSGPCIPARQQWGYHVTAWRKWPGAVYPDDLRPGAGPREGIPPSQVDLPSPGREAEIRVPSPTRESPYRPGQEEMPGDFGDEPGLTPLPNNLPPAELPPTGASGRFRNPAASGRPGLNNKPDISLPSKDLPNGSPGRGESSPGSAPRGSGALPRLQLRTSGADAVAGHVDRSSSRGPQFTVNNRNQESPTTGPSLRQGKSNSGQSTPSNDEPELLMPSFSTKQLDSKDEPRDDRTSSANPLRAGKVEQAAFVDDADAPLRLNLEAGPSPINSPARLNPLRR